jgi:hypothetical protein
MRSHSIKRKKKKAKLTLSTIPFMIRIVSHWTLRREHKNMTPCTCTDGKTKDFAETLKIYILDKLSNCM